MWTLQFFPDPTLPTNVERVVGDRVQDGGWELSGGTLGRRSLHVSELKFLADGQPFDDVQRFPYGGLAKVWRDRVRDPTTGVFSGGSIYFQGYCSDVRRTGHENGEAIQYTFSDLWWLLGQITYQQSLFGGFLTSHVIMNLDPVTGVKVALQTQVSKILDYALAQLGYAAFAYDVSGLPTQIAPSDEKRDNTCDTLVKEELRWTASATSWVDYTQSPPKIYFACRLAMSATSVAIGDGVTVTSADIVPLYKLQVPQVVINYEINSQVDGVDRFALSPDVYPASPVGGNLGIMRATINLQGFSATEQSAPVESEALDATLLNVDFWRARHNWLNDVTNLVLHDGGIVDKANVPVTSPLPYVMLNSGALHKWMTRKSDGQPVAKQEVTLSVLADYTDGFGNVVKDEEVTVNATLTNLPSDTYTRLKVKSYAEPIPVGLAKSFYDILSVLQYEGAISVMTASGEVSSQQFLGKMLNITGGAPEWSAMNALVKDVDENLETGVVTVKFGANRYLSPGELVDVIRVSRTRMWTYYTTHATTGQGVASEVEMLNGSSRQDSVRGSKRRNKIVASYVDPTSPSAIETRVVHDAINGVMTLETDDPARGQIVLSLADLVKNDALNP